MIIAATGHRPKRLGVHTEGVRQALYLLAETYLAEQAAGQPTGNPIVISGMALGWDTAIALAAIRLNLPLICAVPFDGQDGIWPEEDRIRYRHILTHGKVKIVSEGGYAPWKMFRRNEWMVQKADRLVALWDGSTGGTAGCVKYALSQGKPVENLWLRWLSICPNSGVI